METLLIMLLGALAWECSLGVWELVKWIKEKDND